ncbi:MULTISPECIES: cytochrome c oxidase assembly protein [Acidithrix]|uniref:Cytochrome c oxidase caa3 assembly factor n=1 Tax=Acidithrix ferrooxidans TaxID=1280514 RepID=A0A0D8HK60_9ACTN|nr:MULTISPECIES: cytochrome c oxidase assembly protein [Acidithrix]KJF17481.1 cytochrome c oxidase caa3 assembly factor [Acidithrix ferrooxidans]CAG4929559.1 unnamed protein product [Acidithrix sp. C25]
MVLFLAQLSPSVTINQLLTGFQLDPLSILADAALVATAILYILGVRRLAKRNRIWSKWRTLSFMGSLFTIFFAVGSGFASYDDSVFWMHVIQHLLLMNAAPIMLVLSAPVTLALQASNRSTTTSILKIINSRYISFWSFPIVAWLSNWVTMYAYFLTPLYSLSIRHPLFHYYTHLHFLIAGFFFWSVVLGLDPAKHRLSFGAKLAFLLTGIPFGSFLGIAIMQSSRSIDPAANTLTDTHMGGSILWIFGEIFTFAAIGIIFVQWSRAEERSAKRLDRELYPDSMPPYQPNS